MTSTRTPSTSSASSRANILAHLRGATHRCSAADIADALGCKPVRVAAQLKALTDSGRVRRHSENQCYVYTVAPADAAAAP